MRESGNAIRVKLEIPLFVVCGMSAQAEKRKREKTGEEKKARKKKKENEK